MAHLNRPKAKLFRALRPNLESEADLELFSGVRPIEKKCKSSLPGKPDSRRMRQSEYAILMSTKQALKRYYGVLEKPFKNAYLQAAKRKGSAADNLLTALESRLDNVVYRAGFASTRAEAKQIVSHGHVKVNGKRTTISSFKVVKGDEISLVESAKKHTRIASAITLAKQKEDVSWIDVDYDAFKCTVSNTPSLDSLHIMFKVNHVIELYSK